MGPHRTPPPARSVIAVMLAAAFASLASRARAEPVSGPAQAPASGCTGSPGVNATREPVHPLLGGPASEAVRIARGERACLLPASPWRGASRELVPVASAEAGVPYLAIIVDPVPGTTWVTLRNTLDAVVSVELGVPVDEAGAFGRAVLVVEPGQTAAQELHAVVPHLYLLRARMLPPEPAPHDHRYQLDPRRFRIGTSLGWLRHAHDHKALNRELSSNGYATSPIHHDLGDFTFDILVNRFRLTWINALGVSRTLRSVDGGPDAKIGEVLISLHAGADVVRHRLFSLSPALGVAGGDIHVRYSGRQPLEFSGAPENGRLEARQNVALFTASLAVENVIDFRSRQSWVGPAGLAYGARVGWAQQIDRARWAVRDPAGNSDAVAGGPAVDLSGVFVRLSVGIQAGWPSPAQEDDRPPPAR